MNKRTGIGIEYDMNGIRGVKIGITGEIKKQPVYSIEKLEEVPGNFAKDEELVQGLKKMKSALQHSGTDTVVTCVAGKQLYAAQIPFRKLPEDEMRSALKFEIRKNVPFEVAGAVIEYQFLDKTEVKNDSVELLVGVAVNVLFEKHLRVMEKAGFRPHIVDLMPCAVANTFWDYEDFKQGSHEINVVLYIGPEFSTLVIDGKRSSFYHRLLYFSARELMGDAADAEKNAAERERKINGFTDELMRSISYYESNYHTGAFSVLYLLGECGDAGFLKTLTEKTGLPVEGIDLVRCMDASSTVAPGRFDLACSLALRDEKKG